MSAYIPESLRNRIVNSDQARCCYCLTSEANSPIPMTYDRIQLISKGGETTEENVCLACRSCNEFKGDATDAVDLLTKETLSLFNLLAKMV